MNRPFNLHEAIINHVDSGDLILDIIEAQIEFQDDKHAFGVRVANILNDFAEKVETVYNETRDDLLASAYMQESIDRFNALGDFKLKNHKETA